MKLLSGDKRFLACLAIDGWYAVRQISNYRKSYMCSMYSDLMHATSFYLCLHKS